MLKSSNWPEAQHAMLVRKFGDGPYKGAATEYTSPLNMNLVWPGKPDGLLVERIDHEVWTRAILAPHRKASLVIDLHSLGLGFRTPIFAADGDAARLSVAAGIPYIVDMRWTDKVKAVNTVCRKAGIPTLTIEPTGQGCVVPESVEETRVALFNMVRFLRMLPGKLQLPPKAYLIDPWRSTMEKTARPTYLSVKALRAGLLVPHRRLYDLVKKGDLVCELFDIYSGKALKTFRAARSGILYSMTLGGICNKGERLFIISDFKAVRPTTFVRQLPASFAG
jgi:predicted deacylase